MTFRSRAFAFALTAVASSSLAQSGTNGGPADSSLRAHARALTLALAREIAARPNEYFGVLEGAERYVAQIDSLPDALSDVKLAAHDRLLKQYEYLDVDEALRRHAAAIIELGRRSANTTSSASAFLALARVAADYLHPDSALVILAAAETELRSERAATLFKEFRNRYALIGTRAPPITADHWLDAGGSPLSIQPGNGKVTLIEFTAHWCVPCQNSYSDLRALAGRFRDRPFGVVLVSSLYGYAGSRKSLTPEQEVAADREYFTRDHALPFAVAISSTSKVNDQYRVGAMPQFVIVDKRGVIRQIVTGWDRGNLERIGRLIEELVQEKNESG